MTTAGFGANVAWEDTKWTPSRVKQFMTYMYKNAIPTVAATIVYRGTSIASPLMEPAALDNIALLKRYDAGIPLYNFHPMSTTTDKKIASEFIGRKKEGFIHVLHLAPGCSIYDMAIEYSVDGIGSREKEILLMPGHIFTPIGRKGKEIHWSVKLATIKMK